MKALLSASKEFEISQEQIEKVAAARLKFIKRFPKEDISKLSIDEYFSVGSKDSFCYLLEFDKEVKSFGGIGGGSASKFGIYQTRDGKYYSGTRNNKKLLEGEELEREFRALKDKLLKAIELVEKDQISRIPEINMDIWQMVLSKILCLYYPDQFLNVFSFDLLERCAEAIDLSGVELSPKNLVLINHECRKKLSAQTEFEGWNYVKLGAIVWDSYNKNSPNLKSSNEPKPQSTNSKRKYWIYAPSRNAEKWNEFYEAGIMGLGWAELGDLSQYESQNQIAETLRETQKTESSKKNDSLTTYSFANLIQIGDVIIPKRGRGTYLGYGIVASDYFFDETRNEYKNIRKVDWKNKGEYEETKGDIVLKTLTDVTKYTEYVERLKKLIGIDIDEENLMSEFNAENKSMNFPLNQILYGCPGTGKTYSTSSLAVAIIENTSIEDVKQKYSHKELAEKIKYYKDQGRIDFITFHQSFSYEDFIEGIKPSTTSDNRIKYEVKDGIFKNIAARADGNGNYVLIIDEINRGNIAGILGELITLLEPDKRLNAKNELKAKLPYSNQEFGIPGNLYIIGTMNTADRSVEALDTALRRRFSFIEMNPDPQKLAEPDFKCSGIELDRLLDAINSRIEKLLDKDHAIGHAYFMTIENKDAPLAELKDIFSKKVIPLLQEYFYGDWGKIMLILGNKFVTVKSDAVEFLATEVYTDIDEDYFQKPVYDFTSPANWTLETFKSIYEQR